MPHVRRRPFLAAGSLVAISLLLLGACGEGGPRYTLKQVMVEMDWSSKELMTQLSDPPAATENLVKIRDWMQDGAFARHASQRWNDERSRAFEAERAKFTVMVEEVLATARSGDTAALLTAYGRMRLTCEVCHATFRPVVK